MKFNIINITKATGISKKNNQPFEILTISHLSEFETVSTEGYQRAGVGFTVIETPVSNKFFPILEANLGENLKDQPLSIELQTSMNSRGVIITGFDTSENPKSFMSKK